jgi:hypothetical protein
MRMTIIKTYAEEFASILDTTLPELGVVAKFDGPALEQRRCFLFQVPCPSTAVTSQLSVKVDQSAITVEFLGACIRFSNPREAVTLIQELIEETAIVETWFKADYSNCSFVNVNALPPLRLYKLPGVTRIVRRSWRCKHDLDENMA